MCGAVREGVGWGRQLASFAFVHHYEAAAAEAGLKPGDVIQEINRKPVKNAEEAVRLTENASDKTTLLRVWRDGGSRFVVVDESKAG